MQWRVRLEYNKIYSNSKKSFSDAEIDAIINNAIQEYTEMYYSGNNSKAANILGFEATQQRIDMLQTLVFEDLDIDLEPYSDNIYRLNLTSLEQPYKHHLRSVVKSTDGCTIKLNLEQSGDLDQVLSDANRQPSKKWNRAVGRIRNNYLYVYVDDDVIPTTITIEYLKQPDEVCLGTYSDLPTLDNPLPALKPQVHCDLPEDYHHLVVTLAVMEISRILEDANRLQLKANRLTNIQ